MYLNGSVSLLLGIQMGHYFHSTKKISDVVDQYHFNQHVKLLKSLCLHPYPFLGEEEKRADISQSQDLLLPWLIEVRGQNLLGQ